eukprot:TRINITY_DN9271_c0_g1_i1.p1 TRINITY_DN9271_c0_g1~~TRINITY_DN9271_c0_g1_i1.p1  ORF type:complete len:573 (+),score=162.77 TRINITY_DN9271_c0_g1_i1:57-1775(+)
MPDSTTQHPTPLKWVTAPGDDADVVFRKNVMLIAAVTGVVVFGTSILWGVVQLEPTGDIALYHSMPAFFACVMCLGSLFVMKSLSHLVIETAMYGFALSSLLLDWKLVTIGRALLWPGYVIWIDISLVCRLKPRVTRNLIISLVIWLLAMAFENSFRFGLYDFPFLPSQAERRSHLDCGSLPCEIPVFASATYLVAQVLIFFFDYYFTRGFADRLYKEHDKMNEVIVAAERIASSLSRFDLQEAEETISCHPLPPSLYTAFHDILASLKAYRPYLQQPCLYGEEFDSTVSDTQSPALPVEREVSINCKVNKEPPLTEMRRVSYAVMNLLGTQRDITADLGRYQNTYTLFVETALECTGKLSGVVGTVLGDHVHVSFNAAKRCASHPRHAVEACQQTHGSLATTAVAVSCGVSSGNAHCGIFGCAELMSFCAIGPAVVTASLIERFGSSKGCGTTCCSTVYKDASYIVAMRILLTKVLLRRRAGEQELLLFEVSAAARQSSGTEVEYEWMYELQDNVWESYNKAGRHDLCGDSEAALRCLDLDKEKNGSITVLEREDLRDLVLGREPVETVVL